MKMAIVNRNKKTSTEGCSRKKRRTGRKYTMVGKNRVKMVRNRLGGEQRPKGAYCTARAQQRQARARRLEQLIIKEYEYCLYELSVS